MRETDAGVVIRGKIGMHTSPAYAEDVYVGAHQRASTSTAQRATLRRAGQRARRHRRSAARSSARDANPFVAPLSSRFDELDGQMWLDDVFVPWKRVFLVEPRPSRSRAGCSGTSSIAGSPRPSSRWAWRSPARTRWGSSEHEPTIEYLVDLIADVQTVRSCLTAAERDPEFTAGGLLLARTTVTSPPAASRC